MINLILLKSKTSKFAAIWLLLLLPAILLTAIFELAGITKKKRRRW